MILKLVRNGLGMIFVGLDRLTRSQPRAWSAEQRSRISAALDGHSLYQFYACPFCVKVRRAMHDLGISLPLKDVNQSNTDRAELQQGGGRVMVPCLRIEQGQDVSWMYESGDIIRYLRQRVEAASLTN